MGVVATKSACSYFNRSFVDEFKADVTKAAGFMGVLFKI